MQNVKILEMINNGQIEELKKLIQEEIFEDGLKSKSGARQRYAAMRKYFSYVKSPNIACTMPCVIDFKGEKYTSFVNGYSMALTKETSGEMKLFNDPAKYFKIKNMIVYDGEREEIDFNKIIARAKSQGYKLKKAEVNGDFKYLLHYKDAYFKIGLLDSTYGIINDGEKATVWHSREKKYSPMIIENSIGICVICPVHYDIETGMATVIEVE